MEDWALIRRLAAEGVPNARIAQRLGISRTTVVKAVKSEAPPRYRRAPGPSSFVVFEPRVRALLKETPDMPATVLAERVGWEGSIRWFRDNVKRLRPEHRPIDPADRLTWAVGDAAQCDLWFPPKKIPLEDGTIKLLPVLVITAAHSRFMTGRMIPTRKTEDLLLGSWELIQQLGRVPRRLIWDNERGIGRGQRRAEGVTAFMGTLATKLVLLPPNDPESKGLRRAPQRLVRDLVHARPVVRLAGGLQHPVHRLAGQGQRPDSAHHQGCTTRAGRGRPGCDAAASADPAAPGLAQQDPPWS